MVALAIFFDLLLSSQEQLEVIKKSRSCLRSAQFIARTTGDSAPTAALQQLPCYTVRAGFVHRRLAGSSAQHRGFQLLHQLDVTFSVVPACRGSQAHGDASAWLF